MIGRLTANATTSWVKRWMHRFNFFLAIGV
jgi:hypothetical protein